MENSDFMEWLQGNGKKSILYIVIAFFALIIGCGSYFTVGAGVVGVTFNSIY